MKLLVVVDMQKDFVTGVLGTEEARSIVDAVYDIAKEYDGEVVYTMDTHTASYLETQEGRNLPVIHCVEGTEGFELMDCLKELSEQKGSKVFKKPSFGSIALGEYVKDLAEHHGLTQVELVGVCTDICVISNAMLIKAFAPEVEVSVYENATAGVTVESHNNALDAMKACQIRIEKK